MAHGENPVQGSRFGSMLRDLGASIGELLGGGKLEPEQAVAVEVAFGLLGYLAGVDSIVTSHEAEFVNQLMDDLQLSNRARDLAQQAFTAGRKREISVDSELARFLQLYAPGGSEARKLHDALYRLAAADGRLQPREKAFLDGVTGKLGFALGQN
ncbi:TerB family tellurite resistance protein [Tahibacter harae]|uniref:TerB family tellurite resistance protein n=1 Tax=Tahibacter harae TaxID=2963937 RepID=A0ABT1QVD0_9GAMM|nr:TerB family tellurite resistance protein [Tahibacter harae]MCQ4166246.1 TerB family tellurite resistance protein [Tahibacter harae]